MPKTPNNLQSFNSLVEVVEALRGPDGCPWDKEQTHKSLTRHAIEEAHELAEAIDSGTEAELIEELGDVLLQVVLHAEIARQENRFSIVDVIRGINEKLIRRHTHVFGDEKVKSGAEALATWNKNKQAEKSKNSNVDPFESIPKALPALMRAQKIGDRTVRLNFDWENSSQVLQKLDEEILELKNAISNESIENQQLELGDVLFTLAQLARHLNFDGEQALRRTNQKFESRFIKMQELIVQENKVYADLKISDLEYYWQKAKTILRD